MAGALGPTSPLSPPPMPHAVPEPLQPVLSLLTQGVNVHATRLDALARAIQRFELGAKQAEEARADADERISEAYARAAAAERAAEARISASDARADARAAALERRIIELEGRLELMPPAFEELRHRSTELEMARGNHERELTARAADIAEVREAHAALVGRVDACAEASALANAEARLHAADAQQREESAETNARQRRLTMQANGLQEGHAQLHGLLSEQQAALSALQKAATDAAEDSEVTRTRLNELGTSHRELDSAQAQLTDTVQLGLARAVAAAEATRDDSDKVSAAIAELEGWSRRLERLETDLTNAERRVDGAADEMRRQATHLENSQRNSMLQASQQVALHVKALSGDLLRELQGKATIVETQQLFDAMHKQFLSLREAHQSLVVQVEAQGAASETVADEAASAALQAQGALRGSEKLREETHEWLRSQLDSRPTRDNVAKEVLAAIGGSGDGGMLLLQQQQAAAAAGAAGVPTSLFGAIIVHVRDVLLGPMEGRIDQLEASRRRIEAAIDEISGGRWSQRELKALEQVHEQLYHQLRTELTRKLPSLDQIEMLQATLSQHVQRLPAAALYPHGRWTWTRGKLRAANGKGAAPLLSWTSEKLNTSPTTYGWLADRTYVEVIQAGMYVVSCAVFVPNAPTIAITVNGQVVIRRVGTTRQVVDSTGLIAGSSLRDVLSLSAGSRIAVQCDLGHHNSSMLDAHGLLEMKKLW